MFSGVKLVVLDLTEECTLMLVIMEKSDARQGWLALRTNVKGARTMVEMAGTTGIEPAASAVTE